MIKQKQENLKYPPQFQSSHINNHKNHLQKETYQIQNQQIVQQINRKKFHQQQYHINHNNQNNYNHSHIYPTNLNKNKQKANHNIDNNKNNNNSSRQSLIKNNNFQNQYHQNLNQHSIQRYQQSSEQNRNPKSIVSTNVNSNVNSSRRKYKIQNANLKKNIHPSQVSQQNNRLKNNYQSDMIAIHQNNLNNITNNNNHKNDPENKNANRKISLDNNTQINTKNKIPSFSSQTPISKLQNQHNQDHYTHNQGIQNLNLSRFQWLLLIRNCIQYIRNKQSVSAKEQKINSVQYSLQGKVKKSMIFSTLKKNINHLISNIQSFSQNFIIQEQLLTFQKITQLIHNYPKNNLTMDDIYYSLMNPDSAKIIIYEDRNIKKSASKQKHTKRQIFKEHEKSNLKDNNNNHNNINNKDKKPKLSIEVQDQNIQTARFQQNKMGHRRTNSKQQKIVEPLTEVEKQSIIERQSKEKDNKNKSISENSNSLDLISNSNLLQPIEMTQPLNQCFDKLNRSSWKKSKQSFQFNQQQKRKLNNEKLSQSQNQNLFLSQSQLQILKEQMLKTQNELSPQKLNSIYQKYISQAMNLQVYIDSNNDIFNAIKINYNEINVKFQSQFKSFQESDGKCQNLKQLEKGLIQHQDQLRKYIKHIPAIKIINLQQSNLISLMLHQNLKILNLSSNNLISFNFGKFNCKPTIESQQNNHQVFFPKLQFLNLSHNKIANIHYALTLPELRQLYVEDNMIDHISGQLFSLKLKILDLAYNQIKQENDLYALWSLSQLQIINIIGNDLVQNRKLERRRKSSHRLSIQSSSSLISNTSYHKGNSIHSSISKSGNNNEIKFFPKDKLQQYQSVKIFSQYQQYKKITFNEEFQVRTTKSKQTYEKQLKNKIKQRQRQEQSSKQIKNKSKNSVISVLKNKNSLTNEDKIENKSIAINNQQNRIKKHQQGVKKQNQKRKSIYTQVKQQFIQIPIVPQVSIVSTIPQSTTNSQQRTQQFYKNDFQNYQQFDRLNRLKTQNSHKYPEQKYKNIDKNQNYFYNQMKRDCSFQSKRNQNKNININKSQRSLSDRSKTSSYHQQVIVLKDQIQLLRPKSTYINISNGNMIYPKKRNRSLESCQNIENIRNCSILSDIQNRERNDLSSQRNLAKGINTNHGKQNKRKTKNSNNLSVLSCQSIKNHQSNYTSSNNQFNKPFDKMKVHKNFSIARKQQNHKQNTITDVLKKAKKSCSNLQNQNKKKVQENLLKMVIKHSENGIKTAKNQYQYIYDKHYQNINSNSTSNCHNDKRGSRSKINSKKKL